MHPMKVDINGRLNKIKLNPSKCLLPLFEAVINAIDSIIESKDNGEISIKVIRNNQEFEENISPEIIGFEIKDNGIGFDEKHYEAFSTADTTIKFDIGGKGVGRFLWLKAFESVEIESQYNDDDKIIKRRFSFNKNGIQDNFIKELDHEKHSIETVIYLKNYFSEYSKKCPKELDEIARKIIEHCLLFFFLKDIPEISIIDEKNTIYLNRIYHSEYQPSIKATKFFIKNKEFTLHVVKYLNKDKEHTIYLCANQREVKSISLSKIIPDITKEKLEDENGKKYTYLGYITSQYLDLCVNIERTKFDFPENSETLFDDISFEEIYESLQKIIYQDLVKYIEDAKKKKYQIYEKIIKEKFPGYRILLKYANEKIEQLPNQLSEDKLQIELFRIKSDLTISIRQTGEKLLEDCNNIQNYEQYVQSMKSFLEKENEIGSSELSAYIAHRAIILNILKKTLEFRTKDAKYPREEEIHQIIFPLKKTSDNIAYENHNLWLIDERLSYHSFLTSDMPIGDSKSRPDILIWTETQNSMPYNSITLIEFKRPGRETFEKSPIIQVFDYIREIREGKIKDTFGRPINIQGTTKFFVYIICEWCKQIENFAIDNNFNKSPDGLGAFGYNIGHNAYIEIIHFDKLLTDAIKRNKILLDKLNFLCI